MKFNINHMYIVLLFYYTPFIDSVSGALILSNILPEGGVGSPSQLFRFLLILFSLSILKKNKYFSLYFLFSALYVLVVEFSFFMIHNSIFGLIIGLVYASKLLYLLLVFFTLLHLINSNLMSNIMLLKYIRNSTFISAILLIIPFFLGLGFNTYGEGTFGVKGFFSAGNGLGIFMGIGLLLSIYYWRITREKYSLIISIIILFATIIIGTKTVLIFSILGIIFLIFLSGNYYLIILSLISFVSICFIKYEEIVVLLKLIFDVILYRFQINDSLISFILSNRDVYLLDALATINFDNFFILRLFFGFGTYVSYRDPFKIYNEIDTLESDFSDIFFMYGLNILVLYILYILYILQKSLKTKQYFLFMTFILLIMHSILAGHVIFNGMSGTMLPMLTVLILLKVNEKII